MCVLNQLMALLLVDNDSSRVQFILQQKKKKANTITRGTLHLSIFFCYFENMNLINKWMENKIV